jgi:hypothetical protein
MPARAAQGGEVHQVTAIGGDLAIVTSANVFEVICNTVLHAGGLRDHDRARQQNRRNVD